MLNDIFTDSDSKQASRQGWNLFSTGDGDVLQLQREDEMGIFESDPEAWEFVVKLASEGDKVAIAALAQLIKDAPKEIQRIKKHLKVDTLY